MSAAPGSWGGDVRGALLVAGTTSDAGKSVLVAGLCRSLARAGVSVAPFKAQNMSNNSAVTLDGGEIGRAQALQAQACGLEPRSAFNPVLLKPGSDRTSQLVVQGRARGQVGARDYHRHRAGLGDVVAAELDGLRTEFDVVVCEGAGSPAEINLRGTDLANMGLARRAHLPVVVVGDIDRGGVLAHLFGTVAVLSAADQALLSGFVVNKFRGDPALLAPGLDQLRALTGRPTLGVVPFAEGLWIDAEDSLGTTPGAVGRPGPPRGGQWLRVAAVRLPRISNSTDVEALAAEDGVAVRWVVDPRDVADADLVVVPGSKSTVSDLAWLRETGLADAVTAHAHAGRPVLGVCGGYQMLGRTILDEVESGLGVVTGLGLLDVDVRFDTEKVLRRVHGTGEGQPVTGYEIHHGRVVRTADPPLLVLDGGLEEGSERGPVRGTHLHGLLTSDGYRRAFLAWAATTAGRTGFAAAPDTSWAQRREAQLDLLADLVEAHLDLGALRTLLREGPTPGLAFVPPGTGEH